MQEKVKLVNYLRNSMHNLNSSEAHIKQTLPKAQRTRGLSSSCQSNFLKSYHKFNTNLGHISSSESRL